MEQVDKHHIENYGLNQPAPLASARPEAEQRNKEYQAHLERLKWDEDYRYKWEQNQKEWEERQKQNFYY